MRGCLAPKREPGPPLELRDLKAFVAVAEELHFSRAAARLYVQPSTLSEQIRRLEFELATPLFMRTTRRVELTEAGSVLVDKSRTILGMTESAAESVAALAAGVRGTLRIGMTPPVGPALMPHILMEVARQAPGLDLTTSRYWLPDLGAALAVGEVDIAITCDRVEDEANRFETVGLGGEPLLVGLREDHPWAGRDAIDLPALAEMTLGIHPRRLLPAWHAAQLAALAEAGIDPPKAELADTDLAAAGWTDQARIDWILLLGSFGRPNPRTAVLPVSPARYIPFTMSWLSYRSELPSIRRFADIVLRDGRPAGWASFGS
jgi:DNA-binding transcriptional LysR family regulator